MNNIGDITKAFKLPITYNSKITRLDDNIKTDLELVESINNGNKSDDKSDNKQDNKPEKQTLYSKLFSPQSNLGKTLLNSWSEYFSYDKKFLGANQEVFKTAKVEPMNNIDDVFNLWLSVKNDTGFLEKYQYVDWQFFERLNTNSQFLQFMSVYSFASPIISLLMPVILCIVPFFMLKIKRINITLSKYFEILKKVMTQLPLNNWANMTSLTMENKVYTVVSTVFYIFQLYQNVLSCIRFYTNQYNIENTLSKWREFITHTIKQADNLLEVTGRHVPFYLFNNNLKTKIASLKRLEGYLNKIKPFKLGYKELSNVGYNMKHFYEFYKNDTIKDTINYAFGINAYFEHICGIQNQLKYCRLNKCKFTKKRCSFKDAYYPMIEHDAAVKNSYSLKANSLITGPNAAGKTTLLKTTLFNILISQQIGFGYYKSAKLAPYNYLHCYLNIPDTSGRDSLFQAEARRCKDILDKIKCSTERHFCIFDEIYSGTNPYEATASASSYIELLSTFKNVGFMLTTHYIDICKKNTKKNIKNYHMAINQVNNNLEYTYLLKDGISGIRGGIKVLRDLGYPDDMIKNTDSYLENAPAQ